MPGPQGSACRLIFRELDGPDILVKPQQIGQEILEPALNDTGDVLAWAVAGTTQLVYACNVARCSQPGSDAQCPIPARLVDADYLWLRIGSAGV